MYYKAPDQYINVGQPFSANGIQFPAEWLYTATNEDKAVLGLVEVVTVGTREDDRYFWVTETLNGPTRTIVNTPKDPDMVRAVRLAQIPHVTPRQIRMALTRVNLRTVVEAAIAAGSQDLKDWYEFSTHFDRSNPNVIAMGISLGQTEEQLDALWKLASTL